MQDFSAKLSGFMLTKPAPNLSNPGSWSPRPFGGRSYSPLPTDPSGYDAPEYISAGVLTEKCDVYSFGVVLIELLSGRCASQSKEGSGGEQDLVEWAEPCLESKRKLFGTLMDTELKGQYPKDDAYKIAILALKCVSSSQTERPHMKLVLRDLEKLPGPNTGTQKQRFKRFF